MSDTQPNVDELRSLMARAGADEETIEQIMQQGVYPCISQAKKDLLAEVVARSVEYDLTDLERMERNGEVLDAVPLAAIKEIEEGL